MIALAAFLVAFALSYLATTLLLRVGLGGRFVDVPNDRSSHEAPKPRFGGIAIVGAVVVVYTGLLIARPEMSEFLPLVAGGLIVFGAGVIDDWRALGVMWRLLAQVAAAVIVVASGHVVTGIYLPLVGTLDLGVVGLPFTLLFILASINFYNFIDGIDGLAAGSAVIASGFLALIAYTLGHGALALVCLAVAGASAGFLQFNFPPSRLFMGDGGSTFLGFFFAYIAVAGSTLQPAVPFFIPVLILSSLYLDAGLTLVKRALRGEKIFQAHHTHYYQRLLSLGLNHKQVTVVEYALTVLLGISALIFFEAGGFFPYFLTLCWIAVFSVMILKIRSLERGDRLFWERRTVLVIAGDLLLISLAYFGAYFLRMNFRFAPEHGIAVVKAFPIVLVVRSACFYWYGLYRGVWKYTSTPDVVRIIKAVTTGSAIILTLLVLFYRFVAFPRSLFVIEYFLLIIAIGGSRFASRLFHEFGKEALGATVKRVGIIGAGDYGERLGREIRGTEGKTVAVVCYIDDDREKGGLTLQGIPIVGPIDDLEQICRRFEVDALVLGISSLRDRRLNDIVRLARSAGVPLETRGGHYAQKTDPAAVLFDRTSRGLGRNMPVAIRESTERFYRDKRVLITNGGEALGPALAGELASLGSSVTIQVSSPWEAQRFKKVLGERCSLFIGPLERELEAAAVLRASEPQLVFHCATCAVEPSLNEKDYQWRRIARTSASLYKVLPKYAVESLAHVTIWENGAGDDFATGLAVLSETLTLNLAALIPAAPKVLRLPAVLTEPRLRAALDERGADIDAADRYGLLETEAVAMCLDAAAAYKGRVLLVPGNEPSFSHEDVRRVFKMQAPSSSPPGAPSARGSATLFAPEEVKASVLPGAREVISPICPADDVLFGIVSDCLQSSQPAMREGFLKALRVRLDESTPRKVRTSAD